MAASVSCRLPVEECYPLETDFHHCRNFYNYGNCFTTVEIDFYHYGS